VAPGHTREERTLQEGRASEAVTDSSSFDEAQRVSLRLPLLFELR
jgi:hypothetical protein